MSQRLVYWLCESANAVHHTRANLLDKRGFTVRMFNAGTALLTEINRRRPYIIIIGDEGASTEVQRVIQRIASMPEIQGARLILSISKPDSQTAFLAACSSFRDLIPITTEPRQWVNRFMFATASKPIPIKQPLPQIVINEISALLLPARLVWIGHNMLHLESRVRPPIGSVLSLTGPLAEALGSKSISITVTETERTNLTYRFSDALTAQWSIPQDKIARAQMLLQEMRKGDFGPRYKTFIAVQSAEMRASLVKSLSPSRFDVTTALQKSSMINEPIYISPDIVFIDDKLCMEGGYERFKMMLQNLDIDTPVVVIGSETSLTTLQQLDPVRRFFVLKHLPDGLMQMALSEFLRPIRSAGKSKAHDAIFVAEDNPLSFLEVSLPARLTRLHPAAVQVATPYAVGSFALAKLESPLLKRVMKYSPYVKFFETRQQHHLPADTFSFELEGYLANIEKTSQEAITRLISDMVQEKLVKGFTRHSTSEGFIEPALHLPGGSALTTAADHLSDVHSLSEASPTTAPGERSSTIESLTAVAQAKPITGPQTDADLGFGHSQSHVYDSGGPARRSEASVTTTVAHNEPLLRELSSAVSETSQDLFAAIKRNLLDRTVLYFLVFISLCAFFASAVWFSVHYANEDWGKAQGSIYTDSLRKYAPKAFDKE